MQAQSVRKYFSFGTNVRYLQDLKLGSNIHDLGTALSNLERFLTYLDELSLQVTKRAATDLVKLRDELKATAKDAKLTGDQATRLNKLMTEIRKTLEAELLGFEAYLVTPKRIEVAKLLAHVDELFAPGIFDAMPEIAQYDFGEAGKALAFERPTAAAFHILRGTEAVLKEYYCFYVRQKRCQLMWGPMVTDLRKRNKTKNKTALLNNLDNIRHSFRNPTQHPEKIYDIQEAQDLWSLGVEVINRMLSDAAQAV